MKRWMYALGAVAMAGCSVRPNGAPPAENGPVAHSRRLAAPEPLPAEAIVGGDHVGNGGNVLDCGKEEPTPTFVGHVGSPKHTYELLDFYEGRTFRNLKIDLGAPDASLLPI